MKLVDFKWQINEQITSYIKKAKVIATKFSGEEFSIEMTMVRGMNEPTH